MWRSYSHIAVPQIGQLTTENATIQNHVLSGVNMPGTVSHSQEESSKSWTATR